MKLKIKENHAGIITLNDGAEANYGSIRDTQNMSKRIYYTGKGLREDQDEVAANRVPLIFNLQ